MRKLFIKEVERTHGGMPGLHLDVDCTDGTSYTIPRRVSRATFHDATIAVLKEGNKVISIVKVRSFGKDGRPNQYEHIAGEPLNLDGKEEVVDCRK